MTASNSELTFVFMLQVVKLLFTVKNLNRLSGKTKLFTTLVKLVQLVKFDLALS